MSAAIAQSLGAELGALALVWRFRRDDGVQLGFTSHDRAFVVDGQLYDCEPGMSVSAILSSLDLDADGLTVRGAFTARSLRRDDLDAGRWAGATVEIGLADWERPERGIQPLSRGVVSQVRYGADLGGEFLLELQPFERAQWRSGPPRLSPLCRARLGDGRCGVSMESRSVLVVADAAEESGRLLLAASLAGPADYVGGRLRVMDGPYAGVERVIEAADADGIALDLPLPALHYPIRLRLSQGCDRRFATCRDRFANAAAFDGEPFLPGRDTLVRYGAP